MTREHAIVKKEYDYIRYHYKEITESDKEYQPTQKEINYYRKIVKI